MKLFTKVAMVLVLGFSAASALRAEDAPQAVALDQVPDEAKTAAQKAVPGFAASDAGKSTVDGVITYLLQGTADGKKYTVTVTAEGKVVNSKYLDEAAKPEEKKDDK